MNGLHDRAAEVAAALGVDDAADVYLMLDTARDAGHRVERRADRLVTRCRRCLTKRRPRCSGLSSSLAARWPPPTSSAV